MQETALLQNPPTAAESHQQQWEAIRLQEPGLVRLLDKIARPQGTALVFSHDDPDGITSGLIFKRMLQKKGWKVALRLPEGFMLQPQQLDKALAENPDTGAVFLLDKGTLAPYADYGRKLPVYIVDHHPTPKAPSNCVIYNPSLEKYTWCSTSILAHGIATLAGTRDTFDDFLCLVGLKGDWAIEPVSGLLADFVKPFLIDYGMAFRNMLGVLRERPTQFDSMQREVTCLLSRITEFVHGTGGGGFSYFYHDRDPELRTLDHAHCIAEALEGIAGEAAKLPGLTSLDEFVALLPQPHRGRLEKIFGFFIEDWERASKTLDTTAKILRLENTTIYLFVGVKVPLLPMIGSIKLFELNQKAGDPAAQIIMVSSVSDDYTHVSVRGTGDRVHSGKICGTLQNTLQARFPEQKTVISGGGHPKAAECTVKTPKVTFFQVLHQVMTQLNEMRDLDLAWRAGSLTPEQAARARELGLEYVPATPK